MLEMRSRCDDDDSGVPNDAYDDYECTRMNDGSRTFSLLFAKLNPDYQRSAHTFRTLYEQRLHVA